MIVSMILSGLALLAAIMCLVMIYQEKKRSAKRNAALMQYVEKLLVADSEDESHYRSCTADTLDKITGRVEKLEQGITPDYEAAKQAANAVNDFSKGITNILGFDPMEALKTDRQKGAGDSD